MKCGFCGVEFDPAVAAAACGGCPFASGCRLIRCPRCGYEMPPESRILKWLARVTRRKEAGIGAAKEEESVP